MADSPSTWNEDHAGWTQPREFLRVMAGAAWQSFGGQSKLPSRSSYGVPDPLIGRRWQNRVRKREFKASPCSARYLLSFIVDSGIEHVIPGIIQVAQLKTQHHLPLYPVVGPRHRGYLSNGADLPARQARYSSVNSINETRSCEHRVSPLVHWSRAGMICKARHSHVPIPYSDDPLDHSDVDSF